MLFKTWRRKRAAARPFPPSWEAILHQRFGFWSRLDEQDRAELRRHILVFLNEKRVEGAAGQEITDEVRVLIAAHACLLLLHRDTDYYPGVGTILVYPHAYVAESKRVGPGGVVTEERGVRLGESWHGVSSALSGGPIVLAWDHVLHGAADIHDGQNVALHEFAHALDAEEGSVNGAPLLDRRSMYAAWARVLGAEYDELVRAVVQHRPHVLDAYGASNPAEFFAVATETFFEKPASLRAVHPALYEQLAGFYRQDPAASGRGG